MFDLDDDDNETPEERTREGFLEELSDIRSNKNRELHTAFGLTDDDGPNTFEDFVNRIKGSQFVVPARNRDKLNEPGAFSSRYLSDWIRWRDPQLKEDKVGYSSAYDEMDKEYQKTRRRVQVMPLTELPELLEAFEDKDFVPHPMS